MLGEGRTIRRRPSSDEMVTLLAWADEAPG